MKVNLETEYKKAIKALNENLSEDDRDRKLIEIAFWNGARTGDHIHNVLMCSTGDEEQVLNAIQWNRDFIQKKSVHAAVKMSDGFFERNGG